MELFESFIKDIDMDYDAEDTILTCCFINHIQLNWIKLTDQKMERERILKKILSKLLVMIVPFLPVDIVL